MEHVVIVIDLKMENTMETSQRNEINEQSAPDHYAEQKTEVFYVQMETVGSGGGKYDEVGPVEIGPECRGQSYGEMERDALMHHGSSFIAGKKNNGVEEQLSHTNGEFDDETVSNGEAELDDDTVDMLPIDGGQRYGESELDDETVSNGEAELDDETSNGEVKFNPVTGGQRYGGTAPDAMRHVVHTFDNPRINVVVEDDTDRDMVSNVLRHAYYRGFGVNPQPPPKVAKRPSKQRRAPTGLVAKPPANRSNSVSKPVLPTGTLSRRGRKWTDTEENNLISELDSGKDLPTIANLHQRTVLAIEFRIAKIISEQGYNGEDLRVLQQKWHFDDSVFDKIQQ